MPDATLIANVEVVDSALIAIRQRTTHSNLLMVEGMARGACR